MIDQLNLTLWVWVQAIRGAGRLRSWMPFLLVLTANALVILALTQFYRPVLSWALAPVVRGLVGAGALHYPAIYQALNELFAQANILLDVLLGSYAFGVAYLIFWRPAAGDDGGSPWRSAARAYPRLLLIRLVVVLLILFVAFLLPRLLADDSGELRGNALRVARYGSFAVGILIESLFVYAPLALLVKGRGIMASIRESFVVMGRSPLTTLLVLGVPNLFQIGVGAALRRDDQIIRALSPEIVAWLVLGSALTYVLVNYIVLSAAARVYSTQSGAGEGGRP